MGYKNSFPHSQAYRELQITTSWGSRISTMEQDQGEKNLYLHWNTTHQMLKKPTSFSTVMGSKDVIDGKPSMH